MNKLSEVSATALDRTEVDLHPFGKTRETNMLRLVARLLLSAAAMLLLSALARPAGAQSWLASPGTLGSQTVSAGHATLRLPPGSWLVVSHNSDVPPQNGGQSMFIEEKYLAQVGNGHVVSLISIRSNVTRSPWGWTAGRQCHRRDILFFENANEMDRHYDCMMVDRITFQVGSASTGAMPHHMVCAVYSMVSSSHFDFVSVKVCFNPTLAGLPDEPSVSWDDSAWNKVRITPDRQAYVDRVVAWAKAYHDTVADSF